MSLLPALLRLDNLTPLKLVLDAVVCRLTKKPPHESNFQRCHAIPRHLQPFNLIHTLLLSTIYSAKHNFYNHSQSTYLVTDAAAAKTSLQLGSRFALNCHVPHTPDQAMTGDFHFAAKLICKRRSSQECHQGLLRAAEGLILKQQAGARERRRRRVQLSDA